MIVLLKLEILNCIHTKYYMYLKNMNNFGYELTIKFISII